jgi:hypothetical protein
MPYQVLEIMQCAKEGVGVYRFDQTGEGHDCHRRHDRSRAQGQNRQAQVSIVSPQTEEMSLRAVSGTTSDETDRLVANTPLGPSRWRAFPGNTSAR